MNKYSEFEEPEEKAFDLVGLFNKYLSYWKWFLFSILVCSSYAIISLKFTLPTYEASTSILLKDDQKGGGTAELSAFKEMGLFTQKNNVDNELEVLSKSILTEQVIRELGLYSSYTKLKTIKFIQNMNLNEYLPDLGIMNDYVIYGDECPVLVSMADENLVKIKKTLNFRILVHPFGVYEFTGIYNKKRFNVKASISDSKVLLPFGELLLTRGKFRPTEDMLIDVVMQSPSRLSEHYTGNLSMSLTSKTTSVVNLSLLSSHVQLGKDFLKKLIEVYNADDMNDQITLATTTATFIDDRLMKLTEELGEVESQVENYKQSQGITDIKSQSDMFIQQTGDYDQKRLELETQLSIISDLNNYIQRKENKNQLIPTTSGVKSQGLGELINNYNKLLLQRNRLSRIASSGNQAMIDLTSQIEIMYSSVQSSVKNEMNSLEIAQRDLMSKKTQNSARIRAIPRQEREYQEIKRQQGVKEALFLFLLQKKEEKYLNLSVVEPISKLIDNVRSTGDPVAPKKMLIFLFSLIVGVILPIVGIKIWDLLRYQIANKEELESLSLIPILGEIPKSDIKENVVFKENNTDSFTELIRLLRTNLLFVLDTPDKKVINVVSSIGGEGKTFVAINLAISLSLLDKKVLVIGMDIRKPKLSEYLQMDNKNGLTTYLTGHLEKSRLVLDTNIHANLSVILPGPVPPNPNELLAKPMLDDLIVSLKNEFDYIIVDTAPVGVVSDSFTLNRFADLSLFVVRAEYTPKKFIEEANKLYKAKKLTNLYLVLNDADKSKNNYSYGSSQKYGYGYSENIKKKK